MQNSCVIVSPPTTPFLCWHLVNRGDICPWKPGCLSQQPVTILTSHGALLSHAWDHEGHKMSWVGSRWGRVKQSDVIGFFCHPTDRPSTCAFNTALGQSPHYPHTSHPSPSLPPCSDLNSPSRMDTWGRADRRQEKKQPFYFNGPAIVRWRWKTILSSLSSSLLHNELRVLWWLNSNVNGFTIASPAPLLKPILDPAITFPSLFPPLSLSLSVFFFALPFPIPVRNNGTLMHSG